MYTDGIFSANIFRSHNGSDVFFTYIPQRPLQSILSFLEFGKVLPKEHREDSLAGGCPDAKRRESHRARIGERRSLTQDELQVQEFL